MEFGKTNQPLDQIDFSLPHGETDVLNAVNGPGKVYVGMPRWGVKEWVGTVFPPRAVEKNFATYYIEQFNCIEFNATHYNVYSPERIQSWQDKTRHKDFKFCPKLFNGITHKGPLTDKEPLLMEVMHNLSFFGHSLGPVFIQLSEYFSLKRAKELDVFLKMLPTGFTYFLEIRGKDWFENDRWFGWLKDLGIGAVITDTAGRRDIVHTNLTIPKAFIRFIANGHPTDQIRLDQWIIKIKEWQQAGIEEIYFFVHCEDESVSPGLVEYVMAAL